MAIELMVARVIYNSISFCQLPKRTLIDNYDDKKLQPALTVRICYNYNIEILMKTMIIAIDTDIIPTFSVNLILIFSLRIH